MSTWKIDPAHTDVNFSAKHMMVTTVHGKFATVEGTIDLDDAEPQRSHGEFRVAAASLTTGNEPRDNHLRSADFFDTEHFPTIAFTSTSLKAMGTDRYRVTGDLTIRGTTRPATFDVEVLGFYTGMNGQRRVGLTATTKIDREAWGLTWNVGLEAGGWLVSKDVSIEIDVAADEVPAVVAAATAHAA